MSTAAKRLGSSFNKQYQLTLLLGAIELVGSQASFGPDADQALLLSWMLLAHGCVRASHRAQSTTLLPRLQLPNMESIWWVSALGTFASLACECSTLPYVSRV